MAFYDLQRLLALEQLATLSEEQQIELLDLLAKEDEAFGSMDDMAECHLTGF